MDCSTPGLPILHHLPEFLQIHVQWVCDAIQPFHPLSLPSLPFPASGSFPMSQLFKSGGQSVGVSASVLPMNIQGWFPLRLTDLISLQSKGPSRVSPSTTVGKRQFFGVPGKTDLTIQTFVSEVMSSACLPTHSPCVLNNVEAHLLLPDICLSDYSFAQLAGYQYPS